MTSAHNSLATPPLRNTMLVVDLHCEHGHLFEGWFASAEDLASQQARGLVSCPVCATTEVVRRPSAARLNVSSLKTEKAEQTGRGGGAGAPTVASNAPGPQSGEVPAGASPEAVPTVEALQAMYLQAVRHVLQHTEDVGEGFVKEVRNIHRGDAPQRAVRGQADQDEVAELREEGIDVVSMPLPESLKGPLQ